MKPPIPGIGCALVAAGFGLLSAQTQVDLRTQTKSVDFSNANSTKPSRTGTVLPPACSVAETFLKTDAAPGQNLYVCTSANVWTVQGGSLPSYSPGSYGKVLSNDVGGMQWQSLGGDVTGDPDGLVISKLQGQPVSMSAASLGNVLGWNGAQWTPQAPSLASVFGRTGAVTPQSGDYAAAQITNAVDKTAATTYSAGARQTFVASAGASGVRVTPGSLPAAPQTGDLAVDSGDANRPKLFNGTAWVSMATVPNYFTPFTSASTVTVAGTTHKMGTANLVVESYDNAAPANRVEPDSVRINPSTFDVTVTFAVPQTGSLVINAAGAGGSSGAEASAALDFPSMGAGACAPEQTLTVPGASPGDEVAPGWPSGLENGLMGMMRVSAANTVSVRLCNFSGAVLDPAGATYRARIVRNY